MAGLGMGTTVPLVFALLLGAPPLGAQEDPAPAAGAEAAAVRTLLEAAETQQVDRRQLAHDAWDLLQEAGASIPLAERLELINAVATLAFSLDDWDLVIAGTLRIEAELTRLPDPPAELLRLVLGRRAAALSNAGRREEALPLLEELARGADHDPPAEPFTHVAYHYNLANTLWNLGRREEAVAAAERALAVARERDDPRGLMLARRFVLRRLHSQGDFERAAELALEQWEQVEQLFPPDHPESVTAAQDLGRMLILTEQPEAGIGPLEGLLAALRERWEPDDPAILVLEGDLASLYALADRLEEAQALLEHVLAARQAFLPPGHRDLRGILMSLGAVLDERGDVLRARRLLERALAETGEPLERELRGETRVNLAAVLEKLGDRQGARALLEAAVQDLQPLLPETHRHLVAARHNLAKCYEGLGRPAQALAIYEDVLRIAELREAGAEALLHARLDVARVRLDASVGTDEELRAAVARILAAAREQLPPDHSVTLQASYQLGRVLVRLGRLEEALRQVREVAEGWARQLPASHLRVIGTRLDQARLLSWLHESGAESRAVLAPLLEQVVAGSHARVEAGLALAPRELAERLASMDGLLDGVLDLAPAAGMERQAFELVESARAASTRPLAGFVQEDDSELARLRKEVAQRRRAVQELVAGRAGVLVDTGRVGEAVRLRDAAEHALRAALQQREVSGPLVTLAGVAKALSEGEAAVAYRACDERRELPGGSAITVTERVLVAHVVTTDGELVRLRLGQLDDVAGQVEAWRTAVGAPLVRGVSPGEPVGEDAVHATGEALRRTVLDPVFEVVGEARVLRVCLDDALHLVPLDALPLEEGLVGDGYRLRVEPSLGGLVDPPAPLEAEPQLLALGGIDFDALPGAVLAGGGAGGEVTPNVDGSPDRAGPGGRAFIPLRQTLYEVEGVADLFERTHGRPPRLYTGVAATAGLLRAEAPSSRWIHLATHGYLVHDALLEPAETDGTVSGLHAAVERLAPLSLTGLALAGANHADEGGRLPGVLSAEELAALDLSGCELVVLSACETGVGLDWAGEGVASLREALALAGARSSITSLWKVDDAWTRQLMVDVYRRLWVLGQGKAQALWEAKRALRAAGAEVRDWSAWVLVGEAR